MAQGRHIAAGDTKKALISETLANANHLKIGDKITGMIKKDVTGTDTDVIGKTFDYEIVGLFKMGIEQPADRQDMLFVIR